MQCNNCRVELMVQQCENNTLLFLCPKCNEKTRLTFDELLQTPSNPKRAILKTTKGETNV